MSNQTDNRLPIDPVKLTVGEEYEYQIHPNLDWRPTRDTTQTSVSSTRASVRRGSYKIRAAQPPIESLRPGDVVEQDYNIGIQRMVVKENGILTNLPGGPYPEGSGSCTKALEGRPWRLVYRAENVPQQKSSFDHQADIVADAYKELNKNRYQEPEEAICPKHKRKFLENNVCRECRDTPRPFSWADLKPGDVFEIRNTQRIHNAEWQPRQLGTDGKVYSVGVKPSFVWCSFVRFYDSPEWEGRWPTNKSTESSGARNRSHPHTGSAVSNKPAHYLCAACHNTFLQPFTWGGDKCRLCTSLVDRVIPWDGTDLSVLKPGVRVKTKYTDNIKTIEIFGLRAGCSVTGTVYKGLLLSFKEIKGYSMVVPDATLQRQEWIKEEGIVLLEALPPSPKAPEPKCTCGSSSVGSDRHSSWCDKK